ncbi:hypothetical protein Tco_1006033 [Tanacetum coccineum]|uniref:Uncharacterized protein n=1 Tax=Tanacetum coccineum TaxID=301880 RepID=A0ABQ5FGM5_9ASTR
MKATMAWRCRACDGFMKRLLVCSGLSKTMNQGLMVMAFLMFLAWIKGYKRIKASMLGYDWRCDELARYVQCEEGKEIGKRLRFRSNDWKY